MISYTQLHIIGKEIIYTEFEALNLFSQWNKYVTLNISYPM